MVIVEVNLRHYILLKTEVKMESNERLKVLCGKIWVTGKAGSHRNKIGTEQVV